MSFQIWSVINLTPDSFYKGSRFRSSNFLSFAENSFEEGVDVLDIGAESSRPFSKRISADEEWLRLEGPLKELKKAVGDSCFSHRVSIDTCKPEIAERCLDLGIGIINDITGLESNKMTQLVSDYGARIVIMHSRGRPKTMQRNVRYQDVTSEIQIFLEKQTLKAIKKGIHPKNIIWDYGIGFGKEVHHNLKLLKDTRKFKGKGYPIMVGLSRKSFIGKILNLQDPEQREGASLVLHTYLALEGVDILRVHDVRETCQMRILLERLSKFSV